MKDDQVWTVRMLKEYFDEKLASRDQLYDQHFANDAKALEAAFCANDLRLKSMNEFRDALNDSALRNITRAEAEASLGLLSDRYEADIKPMQEKLADLGKPNWAVISVCMSLIAGLVAVVWLVINLQIQASESPISLSVTQLKEQSLARDRITTDNANTANDRIHSLETLAATGGQADSQSRTDRSQLNDRVRFLESSMQDNTSQRRANEAKFAALLGEIETQFCGSDVVRNLMHANELRMIAMLWKKTFPGADYPTDNAYYPHVCNRPTDK